MQLGRKQQAAVSCGQTLMSLGPSSVPEDFAERNLKLLAFLSQRARLIKISFRLNFGVAPLLLPVGERFGLSSRRRRIEEQPTSVSKRTARIQYLRAYRCENWYPNMSELRMAVCCGCC